MVQLYENSKDFCSCCPRKCLSYLEKDDPCQTEINVLQPDKICGPNLGEQH